MNVEDLDQDFVNSVIDEDELGVVIRVHLHIEYWIDRLLKLKIPYSEHLTNLQLDYSGKIHLLLAMGLKDQHKAPLEVLGKIRNDFAHNLNHKIDKGSINNLYKSLSQEDKEIAHRVFKITASEENKKYGTFRKMPPKDQFVFMAAGLRSMLKAATHQHKNNV